LGSQLGPYMRDLYACRSPNTSVATSRLHTLEEIGDIDEEITRRPRVGINHSRLTHITSPSLGWSYQFRSGIKELIMQAGMTGLRVKLNVSEK
jgi:hypothetical protein